MKDPALSKTDLQHAFWLASRGAQQMDLALRFSAAALARGLGVVALKGISIADELYGGVHNRPMADIDFLVVDTRAFELVAQVARSLGLMETEGSDHALVFKEPGSGVVLELHVSLTACPGLFTVDHEALWERRAPVAATPMFRLSSEDLVVHLALHTAFQHAFVAGPNHASDFVRALETLQPEAGLVLARAREWGAVGSLGAMAFSCRKEAPASAVLGDLLESFQLHCPKTVRLWLEGQERMPPPMSIADLAHVRYALAPSKWGYVRRSLFPGSIPGRRSPRPGTMRRLANLVRAGLSSAPPARP